MKFYEDVKEQLGHRKDGFDYIFEYLKTIKDPFIVETGCARELDNYGGDGQSSLLFDKYIKEYGGSFWTVDIDETAVKYCRSQMTSSNSLVILDDSINNLKMLNQMCQKSGRKIDFLYLDSFDAPRDDPEVLYQSAIHHLYELTTIIPSLKPGALIGVDDNWTIPIDENSVGLHGKGRIIFEYFSKIKNNPCFMGYQIFWKM